MSLPASDLPVLLGAAALVAGVVTSVVVPPLVRLAVAFGAVERPGAGGRDPGSIPRLGGVAMVLGVALACGLGAVVRWPVWSQVIPRQELAALAFGVVLVFVVGVVDDLVGVSPGQKLLVQLLAAWLVVRVGWAFHALRLPGLGEIDLGAWGPLLSIAWVVGVTNAINLVDGLDGLAGGVAAIIAASLLAYSLLQDNQATAVLLAAVVGACLGFLWHNWEPARIFMGDGGSLTLGYLFGALTLHSSIKAPAAVAIVVPLLALGLPVIDTLLVMVLRFFERGGRSLVQRFARVVRADRSHLHHALERLVRRRGRIVVVLYVTVLLFCLAALAVALTGQGALGLALLGVEVAVVVAMRALGFAAGARRLALEQRDEARRRLPWWREAPAGEAPAGGGITRES